MPSDSIQMLRNLIAQIRAVLEVVLPEPGYKLVGDKAKPLDADARRLSAVWRAFDSADSIAAAAPGAIALLLNEPRLSEDSKRQDALAMIARVTTDADDELARATSLVDDIKRSIAALVLTPRPKPADATQEAALAGLKTDVRMVLDGAPDNDVITRLLGLVEKFLADDDQLAVWLLTTTDWPELYLASRAIDAQLFTLQLPDALAPYGNDEQRDARRVLQHLDGPRGLSASLLAMQTLVRIQLDRVREGIR